MDRAQLLSEFGTYATNDPVEKQFISRFVGLLQHQDAFLRSHLPGHITGSAWIIDKESGDVLLTHHAKLNRWLQPGGHADGDENVMRVAAREAQEETGLQQLTLVSDKIFDIDIHTIPARGDMPAHLHFDIRYLFYSDKKHPLVITHESHDLRWIALAGVADVCQGNESMMRMARKASSLL